MWIILIDYDIFWVLVGLAYSQTNMVPYIFQDIDVDTLSLEYAQLSQHKDIKRLPNHNRSATVFYSFHSLPVV